MRNPLELRNKPGARPYLATYVDNTFAEENPFRVQGRRRGGDWPRFEAAIAETLPLPVYPSRPDVLACYRRCWEIAFANFRRATDENGFVSDYSSTMFEDSLYLWDSVFITLFGRYGERAWKFQRTLDNFYAKQHPDGGICRQFREEDGSECFARFDPAGSGPNVLGFSEWEYYRFFQDRERLSRVFPALVAYGQWYRRYRTWPNGSYWGTGWASGMINQPRTPEGSHLWFDHAHRTWVDTNMQQVLANRVLLEMADVLGRRDQIRDFEEENALLVPWINHHLWDESTGFYHDLARSQSRVVDVKTIGAYWALLADAVPAERIELFVDHLRQEEEFKRVHRVPSLSADTEGYDPDGGLWLGGVWAPTNYMVLRGLSRHGYHDLAYEIAHNHYFNVVECFGKTGSVWEHLAPDAEAEGRGRKDFVGWTGITPIAVLFEYILGFESDPERRRLTWNLRTVDEVGVQRYPFGSSGSVDLLVKARTSPEQTPELVARTNEPLELELIWAGGRRVEGLLPR